MFLEFSDFDALRFLIASLPYFFWLGLGLFIVVGGILDYHWRTYGVGIIRLAQFRLLYVGVGLLVLIIMYTSYTNF